MLRRYIRTKIEIESLREISKDNEVRVVNFDTSKNLIFQQYNVRTSQHS